MNPNLNNEGDPCERNSDCPSNICKMIYRNGQPIGRKCLVGNGTRYTKSCRCPKDCQSGRCEPIYDATGRLVAKRCAKAEKIDRNIYIKGNYDLNDNTDFFIDLQSRRITYFFDGYDEYNNITQQQVALDFFNPKIGLFHILNNLF